MKILVTGAAGFIGFHVAKKLIDNGHEVIGLDNINDYYSVELKLDRLLELGVDASDGENYNKLIHSVKYNNFTFVRLELQDRRYLPELFKNNLFEKVVNLAAQAGVRYSLQNPEIYIDSNIVGFANLLECCRRYKVNHLIFASSSSVYGENEKVPFGTDDPVDHPISLYAATKKSNELMAYTYSHLYKLHVTGLRFFTVYGPWGRPDMAMFLFTDAILKKKPIKLFNNGIMERDFTFIDDIVTGILSTIQNGPVEESKYYALYNIGNSEPVKLLRFIEEIEKQTNLTAIKMMLPMQPGDVSRTWADVSAIKQDYNYKPSVSVKDGIRQFLEWYREYYKL
ncbi:NAD-dependent epimerase/dehydratase family protein [uncultured Christiangramia sp.]|uniref:NAD-dependent epimerase/dehydratase family protein n=1 Tax=Christiangramia sp. 3-2217-3z TaxID=3417564 RepID=UPI0026370B70|nr:NAD-dependent epimerase/dehydratase family protein [uncultured Christiangramia sp.]